MVAHGNKSRLLVVCFSRQQDPHLWTADHVQHWLFWASTELNLNLDAHFLSVGGGELCEMERQTFLSCCPNFVGDILWEHLDILKRGKCYLIIDDVCLCDVCLCDVCLCDFCLCDFCL